MKQQYQQQLFDKCRPKHSGLFHKVGRDTYFVNNPCILSLDSILVLGKSYVLVYANAGSILKMFPVELLFVSLKDNIVQLLLLDILLHRRYHIEFPLHNGEVNCHFYLLEIEYLQHWLDQESIKAFCAKK